MAPVARRGPGGSGLWPSVAVLVGIAAVGAVWVGGAVGAARARLASPGNPFVYVVELARHTVRWPGTVSSAVTGVLLVLLAALVAAGLLRGRTGRGERAVRAAARFTATPADLDGLTPKTALTRARDFRPSLPRRGRVPVTATGVLLGRLMPAGVWVVASFEDVILAIMAPRSQKTTALAVPAVINAPGPVAATSMKPDLVDLTAAVRSGVGRVWRFDPQQITAGGQQLWWNPLAHVRTIDTARLLAAHFLQEVSAGGSDADFWANASLNVLANLLLAAGVSGGTLRDVWRWVNTATGPEPSRLLAGGNLAGSAAGLRGTGAGAEETREGIYENVRTACACLADDAILAWVTPPPIDPDHPDTDPAVAEFRPAEFVSSRDTLYLLSQDDAGAAQPLIAALVDEITRAGTDLANRQPNRRLDPPLLLVLDEAANICKIRRLPQLYSHLGSRSIVPVTILQSYDQAELVWGQRGARALWSAATIKLFGAGLDSPTLTDTLSRLVGDHDVHTTTVNTGNSRGNSSFGGGGGSRSTSVTREPILPPAAVRTIPKGWAVLLATGHPAAILQLQPWYRGDRRKTITAAQRRIAAHAAAELAATKQAATDRAAAARQAAASADQAAVELEHPQQAAAGAAATEQRAAAYPVAVGAVAVTATAPAVNGPATPIDWDTVEWETPDDRADRTRSGPDQSGGDGTEPHRGDRADTGWDPAGWDSGRWDPVDD